MLADHIRAVLFDLDDTLVGTIGAKWAQHTYIAKTFYDHDLLESTLREHWGKPLPVMAPLLYDNPDWTRAEKHILATRADYPKALFPTTVPTLEALHGRGLVIGVVTATSRRSIDYDFETLGIPTHLVQYRQAAEDTAFHKPDARVFEPAVLWLAEQGIRPAEVLYVGDGLHDLAAATGAGFAFAGVTSGLIDSDQFTAAGARSMTTIAELLEPHSG